MHYKISIHFMTLDTEDKNYIHDEIQSAIDRQGDETRRYIGILTENFNHKLDFVIELVKDKPGREEVRDIVREEARYVVREEMARVLTPLKLKGAVTS